MADKSLLFTSTAGQEINTVQSLEQRVLQVSALGGANLAETSNKLLARDSNGSLVANPVLTEMLNSDFVSVIRRGLDGNMQGDSWVTFSSTSNAENDGVDPEKSLLVSLNDLILNVEIPSDADSVTATVYPEDNPYKYYGKKIDLNDPDEQVALWNSVCNRTVRLHKNNGKLVSGVWSIDVEAINRRTPDVLHLSVTQGSLAIELDPSKVQTIPVIFTPDDGQDEFNLLLFIKPFDFRPELKQFKISNSTAVPAEAQFVRPWIIVSTVDSTTLTGAKSEGGLLKLADLTNCVKAVDKKDGSTVSVTVTVKATHCGFNTTGTLDSVKIPSVPAVYDSSSQLKNLVEDGLFTVKATVSAEDYESQEIDLSVCINAEDERPEHLTIVLASEALSTARTLVNGTASTNEVSCKTRYNEADSVVDSSLTISGITAKNNNEEAVEVTTAIVNDLGADSKTIYVVQNATGVTGYMLVKVSAKDYVTETIKLPVALKDNRLPDGVQKWSLAWTTEPSITIPVTEEGTKGDPVSATVSSQGLEGALVATVGELTNNVIKDQWGHEETVVASVVGIVDSKHALNNETSDYVDIPENAYNNIGCHVNMSFLTATGFVVTKLVKASVTDNRSS